MAKKDCKQHYVTSGVDLFADEGFDLSIISSQETEIFPTNPVSEATSPPTFFLKGTEQHYIDLSKTRMYFRCKITDAKGVDLTTAAAVAPVNNILHSMFNSCTIFVNDTQITPISETYHIRSIIERELLFSKEYNKTQSSLAGYFKEEDPTSTALTGNDSYQKRHAMSKQSKEFEVIGRPHADIFTQDKFLPPGCDLRVIFTRSSNSLCLHAPVPSSGTQVRYQLHILEAKMIFVRHKLLPAIALKHLKMWEANRLCNFNMNRVEVKSYALSTGTSTHINENVVTGQLPSRIVIGLVASANVIGSYPTTPFLFNNHELSFISVSVCGDENETKVLNLDFRDDSRRVKEAMYNLHNALGITNQDCGIDLTEANYTNGRTFFAYDLSSSPNGLSLPRNGNVKIELKFRTATTVPLTVFVYTESQGVLHIDKHKNVYWGDYYQG